MPDQIVKRLADLPAMTRVALRDLWTQLFDASPCPRLRSDTMIRILAHRLQEPVFGSLSAGSRSRLRYLSKLGKTDLHNLWRELCQEQRQQIVGRDLLIQTLGYRLQEHEFRPLTEAIQRLCASARRKTRNG
jgi:hypothetical protein